MEKTKLTFELYPDTCNHFCEALKSAIEAVKEQESHIKFRSYSYSSPIPTLETLLLAFQDVNNSKSGD